MNTRATNLSTARKSAPKADKTKTADKTTVEAKNDAPTTTETETETETAPVGREVKTSAGTFMIRPFTEVPSRKYANASPYPFEALEPGNYIFVPNEDGKLESKTLSTIASSQGKRLGKKFTVRTMEEDGVEGIGIFCVDPNAAEGDKAAA